VKHRSFHLLVVLTALLICSPAALLMFAPDLRAAQEGEPSGSPATAAVQNGEENGLEEEALALFQKIKERTQKSQEFASQFKGTSGEERNVLIHNMSENGAKALQDARELMANILQQEKKGYDTSSLKNQLVPVLEQSEARHRMLIKDLLSSIKELRKKREEAPPEERLPLEEALADETALLDKLYASIYNLIGIREELELDSSKQKEFLSERLTERAEFTSARVELSLEEIQTLQVKANEDPEDKDIKARLKAAEEKQERVMRGLQSTVDIMEQMGLETAEHRQLMIQATGDITADIFDKDVALGLLEKWLDGVKGWATNNGPQVIFKVLLFVLILALFKILARFTRKIVTVSVSHSKLQFSQLLQNMFITIASKSVMILGVLIALSQIGVELAPLLAGLGIAGFIIGFALQGVLGNFASGLMILLYRPFDVGDEVEASGAYGVVSHMSLVSTTILTYDKKVLIVPNNKVWGEVITNFSSHEIRRVDLFFSVSYSEDIPRAEKVLMQVMEGHEKVLDDPASTVVVFKLADSSVDLFARPFVKSEDYWQVHYDIRREVKLRFDREGITIPFPQRDVHIYNEEKAAG